MHRRKVVVGVFYIASLISIYTLRGELLSWLDNLAPNSWPIILLVSSVIAMFPIIPFALVSGILGIKYGVWTGGAMSLFSSTLAAVFSYWIFATRGRANHISSQNKLFVWNEHVQRRPFLFILIGRLLSFIPAMLINGYSGWLRISFFSYVIATFLGKIPTMLVFAYLGISTVSGSQYLLPILIIYAVFLFVVYVFYKKFFYNISAFRNTENEP
ncbi:TVP38/TMEM64 family protein [Paenibacillus typhae]|uniref:TVP38/TMEM64 family membrane protein n=1 Tax=Paenibacillus typhae TaxID=1174501 RepID=A0A1G8FAC4_9BACL|nr:VTT domain-containing protein [Paenibacillus typhae]SDH79045.1 Uncharacterized membrane protein YdjX, TVP38/TMEM64 family, SNARE-associated domain [Paenibacillus typhae]